MEWNQRLAQARKACGLTQQEAADRIRQYLPESDWVQKVTLSSWEQGRTQPRIPHALALALLYHTDPYYLFGTAQMSGGLNEEGLAKLAEFRELLLESPRYHEGVDVSRKVRYLPVFLQPASAGTGQWLDDDLAEEMEVDDAVRPGPNSASDWRATVCRHGSPTGRSSGRARPNRPRMARSCCAC